MRIKYTVHIADGKWGVNIIMLLAVVAWFLLHPSKNIIGKPAQVWCCNQFETGGVSSFLPVCFLQMRCAHVVRKLGNLDESVMIVVPLVE